MKLSLVSCRSPFLDDDRIYPPLGLLYLKAAVHRELLAAEVTAPEISPPLTRPSSRAATFTPSPKMSPSLTMTSPTLTPIRKRMHRPSGSPSFAL